MDRLLHYAAREGDLLGVELALRNEDNTTSSIVNVPSPLPGAENNRQARALHVASSKGDVAIVRVLLDAGADMEVRDSFNRTPLHVASSGGHGAIVRVLLDAGADMEARDASSRTPLHVASSSGHVVIVSVLLDAGADMDVRDSFNRTPLHKASYEGHLEVVRELVQQGADIYAQDTTGNTPFDLALTFNLARTENKKNVLEYLLQRYLEKIFECEGRRSLLTILKQCRNSYGSFVDLQIGRWIRNDRFVGMLRYFVEQEPYCVRERDGDGNLPLHIACHCSDPLVGAIQYLVQLDTATIHIPNNAGNFPLHLVCQSSDSIEAFQVINFFIGIGGVGVLQARNSYGAIPLHVACTYGAGLQTRLRNIKLLVENDPGSVLAQDVTGCLPLHCCCHSYYSYFAHEDGSRELAAIAEMKYLMEQDPAMLHISNKHRALPIHLICREGASLQAVKCFVEANGGAGTLCARDENGNLPLHALCGSYAPSLKAVEYLVNAYRPALLARNRHGDLPVIVASRAASLDIIYKLIRGDPEVVPS